MADELLKFSLEPQLGGWPDIPVFSVPLLAGKWSVMSKLLHREIKQGRLKATRKGRAFQVLREDAIKYEEIHLMDAWRNSPLGRRLHAVGLVQLTANDRDPHFAPPSADN